MLKGISYYKKLESTKKNPDVNFVARARRHYINYFAVMNIGDLICFDLVEKYIDRELEVFEELKKESYIEYTFIDKKTIKIKILCKPKKILNKGLEIREKKRKKQAVKRHTIHESQNDLVRIVKVTYPIYKREYGKNKFDRMSKGKGVQVENKVYFLDRFIYVNKKRVKIEPINDVTNVPVELLMLFEEKKAKLRKS